MKSETRRRVRNVLALLEGGAIVRPTGEWKIWATVTRSVPRRSCFSRNGRTLYALDLVTTFTFGKVRMP